jgi:hypothetical protein
MEDLLKDLGLSLYADRLRDRNFTIKSFISVLNGQSNAHQLRESIMYQCGLSSMEVLAIQDAVKEKLQKIEMHHHSPSAAVKIQSNKRLN